MKKVRIRSEDMYERYKTKVNINQLHQTKLVSSYKSLHMLIMYLMMVCT